MSLLSRFFGNSIDGTEDAVRGDRDEFVAAVAPEALEVAEDRIHFPHGTLIPLALREAGTPGDSRRPLTRLSARELIGGVPAFYSATFRRELPDALRGSLRARRTFFEGVLQALSEKTGRRPSIAEKAADHAMDVAESALARGTPAYAVCLLVGLFTPDEAAEKTRRELESRLRAKGLLPQRFQYVAEQAVKTLQPGGQLFHGIEEATLLLDEAIQLLPEPRRRIMPPAGAVRIGRHAGTGADVYYSFTHGLDPEAPPPPHAITLVLGEMGSGKTTLVRLLLLQRLLQGRTVVTLDPEGENNRLCEAAGGTVIPTTPPADEDTCLLHPLVARRPEEMLLAARFLTTTITGSSGTGLPEAIVNAALHQAVKLRWERTAPDGDSAARRMKIIDLVEALELVSGTIPEASIVAKTLGLYAEGGMFDGFFDRSRAKLSARLEDVPVRPTGAWINFDLSGLREENRRVVHAVLTWFFYHVVTVGKQPVDIFVDEGWRLLRGGALTDMLDELGRRARKRGIGVVLATHLPGDLVREEHTSMNLAATSFVGRMGPEEAFTYFRALGVSQSEARQRAETVANLPPRLFLAAPAGGRSALFPVEVQVPPGWLRFFEATNAFEGMHGRG